ncbi:hypothetical protein E9993_22260 [Labilibacter sediminis]|nr:hypothetical protein E9993_22260 [Labilibacter sediminis]
MRHLIKELTLVFVFLVPLCLSGKTSDSTNVAANHINKSELNGSCDRKVKLADAYIHLKQYNKALALLQKAEDCCKYRSELSQVKYLIGEVYRYQDKPAKAMEQFNSLYEASLEDADTLGIIRARYGLGNYYYSIQNFQKSISYYHRALNSLYQYTDVALKARVLLALSKLYMEKGDFADSRSYAQKTLELINHIDDRSLKAECFEVFSQLYDNLGDYKSAFFYKNKSMMLRDSVNYEQLIVVLSRLENKEASQGEKKAIAILKRENISLNTDWLREKNRGSLFLVTSVLLFVFTVILLLLFRSKLKVSKALKSKNLELQKLNATKDKFFSIIAHDLKSPFNSLMGFSEMLSLHVETKSHADIMEFSKVIHNSTRKLYSLVETLLQWSRTQLGTTEYKPVKLDVKFVSANIISILKINAEEKDIVISLQIDENLMAWADKDLYSAVLRNLITNAIKFSRVGSVINVSSQIKHDNVIISVSDSGVGISKENMEKIFRVDANPTTEGTFKEKGTGLGLVLCKEFVEINKGTIWVESELEKGSTFKFTVPLLKNND